MSILPLFPKAVPTLPLLLLLYDGVDRASSGIDISDCLPDLVLPDLPLLPVDVDMDGDVVVADEFVIDGISASGTCCDESDALEDLLPPS